MAYLDEDILYNNVEEKYKSAKGKAREAYSDVLDTICEMPRADVVPKSEVEKLIIDRNAARLGMIAEHERLNMAKTEVAREIFAEIERTCVDTFGNFYIGATRGAFAELKKKYTEGTNHG